MVFLGILIGFFFGIAITGFALSHCSEDKFNEFIDAAKKARERNGFSK